MSEAARLEQALQEAEPEIFDLREVVEGSVQSYRAAWPRATFEWNAPDTPCPVHGVPDLIVQMLDKLIANALDFHTPGTPITVVLVGRGPAPVLEVRNLGPVLPEAMADKLFESMVSIREGNGPGDPHLGLGLYIVRLIAEHHGGTVGARNLVDEDGVSVWVDLPASGP